MSNKVSILMSPEDFEFFNKINEQPKLKVRFMSILSIAQSECEGCQTADQAEDALSDNLRLLGNEAMHGWGNTMQKLVDKKVKEENTQYELREKKLLKWNSKYGPIVIRESVWRGPDQSYYRPLRHQINVSPRGCPLPLQRVLTAFGSEQSFENAVFSIKEHYGIDISPSAIRRSTYKHAHKAFENQEKRPKVRKLKSSGKEQIIAEADGSFLPIVKIKAGEGDGRKRREVCWEEAQLTVAQGKGETSAHYGVSLKEVDEVGEVWAQTVEDAGWGSKSKIHVVGDGATWITNQSKKEFGKQGKFLLDFFHASEYLGDVAKEKLEEKEQKPWLQQQQGLLKNNEWSKVLESIKVHIDEKKLDCAAAEAYRYLGNRKDQLDYKGALEEKLPIGSGLIESGHRHVLQSRLKIPGAFWLAKNVQEMAQLLCT